MPSRAVHRAAVYTVRVRPKRTSDYWPFGDIDGKGASLAVALQGYLGEFEKESDDETRLVACDTATIDGDDLLVMLRHGQRGLTAEIIGPDGAERYHQTPLTLSLSATVRSSGFQPTPPMAGYASTPIIGADPRVC